MTKQQLDLELAKRLKSSVSQNGRMLLGTIIIGNTTSNIFVPNKDGLIQALNSISQTYEDTIKQQYVNNSQTEFFVRIGNNSNILPDSEADYESSSIVYYIDVSLQQLGSSFEYSSFADQYKEYKDSVGYVIYNPSNACLRILKKFDKGGYALIDQCPQEIPDVPNVPIILESNIVDTSDYNEDISDLMTEENTNTIGELIINKMEQYPDKSARIFIVKYSRDYGQGNSPKELFCRVLECFYSSTDEDGTYSILIENGGFQRGIIRRSWDLTYDKFYYSFSKIG